MLVLLLTLATLSFGGQVQDSHSNHVEHIVDMIEVQAKLYSEAQTNKDAALQIQTYNRLIKQEIAKLQKDLDLSLEQAQGLVTEAVTKRQNSTQDHIESAIEKIKHYSGVSDSELIELAQMYGSLVTDDSNALTSDEISSLNTYFLEKLLYELKQENSKTSMWSEYAIEIMATVMNLPVSDEIITKFVDEELIVSTLLNQVHDKICGLGLIRAFDRFMNNDPTFKSVPKTDPWVTRRVFSAVFSAMKYGSSPLRFKKMMHYWFGSFLPSPINFDLNTGSTLGEISVLRNASLQIIRITDSGTYEISPITVFEELISAVKKNSANWQKDLNELLFWVVTNALIDRDKKFLTDLIKLLVNNGAQINAKDSFENTPMDYAGYSDNLSIGLTLLENGAVIDKEKSKAWPLLVTAIIQEKYDEATTLLNHGIDPNGLKQINNNSLALLALNVNAPSQAESKLFDLLIAKGADPNIFNSMGDSLLEMARQKNLFWAKKLIENGAKLKLCDELLLRPPKPKTRGIRVWG